jgi:succinate dehydrogenase / fumarate reductase cytochrome b subunit
MSNVTRPLSPHITIYRKQITSVLSILHRITGVALYVGLVLLVVFLCVVAYSPENYSKLHECLSSILGRLILFGWTLAFYFHFFNGIRHLFWDMGKGFEITSVNKTGWFAAILALLASLMSWAVIYLNMGML